MEDEKVVRKLEGIRGKVKRNVSEVLREGQFDWELIEKRIDEAFR